MEEEIKYCPKCDKEKFILEFYKEKNNRISSFCKICQNKNSKKWAKNNPEKINISQNKYKLNNSEKFSGFRKKWYEKEKKNNPLRFLFDLAKQRAKKNNLEFDIDLDYLKTLYTEFCPILGIKLEYQNNKHQDNSPSIDRIDNSKGYIKENIRIISFRANTLKSNATKEEFKKIIKFYKFPKINNNLKILDKIKIKNIKRKYQYIMKGAKIYNRIFNITFEDFKSLYVENCPVFGYPLLWNNQTGFVQYNSPSLDRIDNSKGYEIGNCIFVSMKVNFLKSNATLKELQFIHDKAFELLII